MRLVDQPLVQPATARPNWWKRNWKWFVQLCCFTVALLFLVFVGSILVIVFSAIKSTDVYNETLAHAKADPAVIQALGSLIKDAFLVSGNTNVNGASSESNPAIPISGPKGKGTIYVSANKSLGQRNYSGLVVEVRQTHERIDLLQKSASFQFASISFDGSSRPAIGWLLQRNDYQFRYRVDYQDPVAAPRFSSKGVRGLPVPSRT